MSLFDELFGKTQSSGMLWHGLRQLCDRIERLQEHSGGPLTVGTPPSEVHNFLRYPLGSNEPPKRRGRPPKT